MNQEKKVEVFSANQAYEIFVGLNEGLSKEAVAIYKKTKFTPQQMRVLREALHKIPASFVKLYAISGLEPEKMQLIFEGIKEGFSFEEIGLYEYGFDVPQMREIFNGLKSGMAFSKVEAFAKRELSAEKMREMRLAI